MIIKYKHHRNLPWRCNISWAKSHSDYLECEIYDPYSRLIFETSILMEKDNCVVAEKVRVFGYGSKQGLLIAGCLDDHLWRMFVYNPYTEACIWFPPLPYTPCFATFLGDLNSLDFQFIVLIRIESSPDYAYYVTRYDFYEGIISQTWLIKVEDGGECRGMQYINDEQLLCLFDSGIMTTCNLQDGSWTSFDKLAVDHNQRLWLAKGDGDLLVAVKRDLDGKCSTFCFDWSNTRWVQKDLPESSAIFISGDITTFVTPFVEYDDHEKKKDCNVYFFSESVCEKEPSNDNVLQI